MMIETSPTNTGPTVVDSGKLPAVDNTEKEFEDILNQLNALGNTIDQELSNAPGKLFGNKLNNINGELSLKTNSQLTNTSATTSVNNRINPTTDLIGLNYSANANNQTGTAKLLTNNNSNLPQNSLLSTKTTSDYYNNHPTSSYHNHQTDIGLTNGGGGGAGTQYYPSSTASVLSGAANSISSPVTGSLNDSQPTTASLNGHEIKSQQPQEEQPQPSDCNEMNKSQTMSNYFTSSPMHHGFVHHDHHLHHYHPMYSGHDVSTPPVLSDDNSGHDSSGMGLINLMSNDHHHHQLRTDSPDNDSAFSDSISLIYSEQSSSSSSNGKMNGSKGTSSGQSSQSVNSSGSSSSCEDNHNHHLPHHHHSHHIHHHTGNNNKIIHQTTPMPLPVVSGKQNNTIASILSPSASSTASSTGSSAATASSASSSSLSSSAIVAGAGTNTKTKLPPEAIDGFDDNNSALLHHHQSQPNQQQQQLLFEQNEKEKDDDSQQTLDDIDDDVDDDDDNNNDNYQQDFGVDDDDNFNTLTRNNGTSCGREKLSINDRIQFQFIDTVIADIDWQFSLANNNNNNNDDIVNKNRNRSSSIDRNCSLAIENNNNSECVNMDYDRLNNKNNIIGGDEDNDFGGDDYGLNPIPNPNTNNNSNDNNNVSNIGVENDGDNGPKISIVDVPCSKNNFINSTNSNVGKMSNDHFHNDSKNVISSIHHYNDNNRNNSNVEDIDEKMRKAIEKIREANIRKLYLKVFAEDDSSKCLLADERMNVGAICSQMAQKNHIALGMNYCIMEHMPQLYLERFYEDHESLVENVLYWGRDYTNKLYFVQQPDKYDLFVQPEKYLISVSQPNENADTLKSGSLRAKYNANQLRTDLIAQFFTKTSTGNVRVPEIEGNLYLRSEGKKVWKKYFFSLRSSGLYYCPKGKPKSTKDLICLTTFELNCIYYGFGWKKKFKAPNDFGFAIKHPQIQMKSPKHIKYLCAESRDELKLWITGIRIAKYGQQLLVNYEQFNNLSSDNNSDDIDSRTITKKISSFTLNNSNNNLQNYDNFSEESHFGHLHQSSGSITMRTNRVPRSDSVRSSSASSSSGCMSEQSSIVSTPSSGSIAGTTTVHENTNYHHHLPSPHHQPLPPSQQQTPLNAFDADFPVGTIKRKPNVMIQPKIPLTNTTRNLALQSDDALLEVSDGSSGGSCGDDESCCMNSMPNPSHHHSTNSEQFQRGTFKTGTLRRSNVDDRSKTKMNLLSPQHQFYRKSSESMNHSDEELPPPPPPPPIINNLKEAESTLSLNASFPPPPPPEILNSSPVNSLADVQNTNPQQQQTPSSNSTLKPPSMAALPLPPMTPQPQMKHRLARRLSDLSENSTYFMNHRNNYDPNIYGSNGQPQHIPAGIYSPNSRASIASSSDSTSFITLKSNFLNGRRFHRQNSLEYYTQQQAPAAWSKYGTSPRLRPFEQPQQQSPSTPPSINGNVMGEHFYRQTSTPNSPSTKNTNYAPFVPAAKSGPTHVSGSHCALISDGPMIHGRNEYNFGQTQIPPPLMPPPPPPPSTNLDSINQSHYGANNYPNKSSLKTQENHYMSISPHLIQKHQQMLQQQQKQQQIYSGKNCPNGPTTAPMSYHVPEDIFLKNMERVMQKKWHVAQMLQQDSSSTPGQVLGFRDSAYLPPGQASGPAPVLPPPPPPESHVHLQASYGNNSNYQHYNGTVNSPAHYPSPVPIIESSASLSYPSSPYHHSMNGSNNVKTVQFADNNLVSMTPPITPIHQPVNYHNNYENHYHHGNNTGTGSNKRVPPPPPKRSESTQLTISCPSRR